VEEESISFVLESVSHYPNQNYSTSIYYYAVEFIDHVMDSIKD
jgi:hypothetical protein